MELAKRETDRAGCRLSPFSFGLTTGRHMGAVFAVVVFISLLGHGDVYAEVVGGLAVALPIGVYGWASSRAVRYRLEAGEMTVRRGIFYVEEQHIPYVMIQNVVRRRTILHRALRLVELRLETRGGTGPEIVLDAITLPAADDIETRISHRSRSETKGVEIAPSSEHRLLPDDGDSTASMALRVPDLVRLGLVTNRGWLVLACAIPIIISDWSDLKQAVATLEMGVRRFQEALEAGGPMDSYPVTVGVLALLLLAIAAKGLSVGMAFARFHGFRLTWMGQGWNSEGGLFDRRAAVLLPDRIQRLCIRETWLAGKMNRQSVSCAMSANPSREEDRLIWLVPLAPPEFVKTVLRELRASLPPEESSWLGVHPRAWCRRLLSRLAIVGLVGVPIGLSFGLVGWMAAILPIPILVWKARLWAKHSGIVIENSVLTWRTGSLGRQWCITWIEKAHGVVFQQTYLDRWCGMATVCLSTSGSAQAAPSLRMNYLAEADARQLLATLQVEIERSRSRDSIPDSDSRRFDRNHR